MPRPRAFVAAARVVALLAVSACTAYTAPEPSDAPGGVTFEQYRQAVFELVECVENHGGTVTVVELDRDGTPDISTTVKGPRIDAQQGTPEFDAALEEFMAWSDGCDAQTAGPVRQAYQRAHNKTAQQVMTWDERWKEALPQVRQCFANAGAPVSAYSTRSDLGAIYYDWANEGIDGPLTECLFEAGMVTDLGDGMYELGF